MNKIVYLANFVTDFCIEKRSNSEFRSYAGNQKIMGLISHLKKLNYEVEIVSPSFTNNKGQRIYQSLSENTVLKIIHLPTISNKYLKHFVFIYLSCLKFFKERKKIDQIIYYNFRLETLFPSLFAKFFLNKKIILEYEDGLDLDPGFSGKLYKILKKWAINYSDGFILVNENLQKEVFGKPYFYCPGILQENVCHLTPIDIKNSDSTIHLAYTGILSKEYGLEDLLWYLDNLPTECHLHITGSYWEKEFSLEEYLKINQIKNASFYGQLESTQYDQLMKKMDYFVLLNDEKSKYSKTNFPSKLFVYLSHLKPIITSKKINIEWLKDEWFIHPKDFFTNTKKFRNVQVLKSDLENFKNNQRLKLRDVLNA